MRTRYTLGWLPDVPDTRDIPFAAVFRVPRKLPARADLRAGCSPVEDQGNLGSCTAQALVGALEFLELRALPSPSDKSKIINQAPPERFAQASQKSAISRFRDLSRLFVYYNERAAGGTVQEDSGAMLRTGIKTLKALGVCREALWPYEIDRFTVKPTAACFTEAADHQVTAYQRLNALVEMKACIAMGLPFVFGFAVYEHVMSATVVRTGNIRLPRKGERMLGGHAVMAVGYDDTTKTILWRNSWGAAWGRDGYGQMPYAYVESRELSDDFWCIQGTESDQYKCRI
ncbi:MAG: C1 family peptidase [Kiritimatiellia bacterium]|jgi:C1A family cysteine protease